MTDSLFRKEALKNQTDNLWGDILILQPVSYYALSGFILAFLIALVLFLVFGTYTRKETVPGYLVPDKGVVKIFALRDGVYSAIHVEQGQIVEKGQVLFTVTDEKATGTGENIDTSLIRTLEEERRLLNGRIEGEHKRLRSDQDRLVRRIQGIQWEIQKLDAQTETQRHRLELAADRQNRLQALAQDGLIPNARYLEAHEEYLTIQQQMSEFSRQRIALENELDNTRFEQAQLPLVSAERVAELLVRLTDIDRTLLEIEGRHAYVVKAPISGQVAVLQAESGQSVSRTVPALNLLPEDSRLEAHLFIPTRAIGFIAPGQAVRFQYRAFPYQRFGVYNGHVTGMTRSILSPGESPAPLNLSEPFYKVSAHLDSQSVAAYGKQLPLQAGMLLEADVVVDHRTLLQWVLDPLYSLRGRL